MNLYKGGDNLLGDGRVRARNQINADKREPFVRYLVTLDGEVKPWYSPAEDSSEKSRVDNVAAQAVKNVDWAVNVLTSCNGRKDKGSMNSAAEMLVANAANAQDKIAEVLKSPNPKSAEIEMQLASAMATMGKIDAKIIDVLCSGNVRSPEAQALLLLALIEKSEFTVAILYRLVASKNVSQEARDAVSIGMMKRIAHLEVASIMYNLLETSTINLLEHFDKDSVAD